MPDMPNHPDARPQPSRSFTAKSPYGQRAVLAGVATAVTAGVAVTAVLVTRADDGPAAQAQKPKSTTANTAAPPASFPASASPDPLTSSAATTSDAPVGGDSKVPDKTGKANSDAETALSSWSSTNPKPTRGSHAVGGGTVTGGGGTVAEVLRIPALGAGWAQPVYEGVGDRQLRAGVGHFPGTEKAGGVGNYAVAGHRSGVTSPPFKHIDRVKPGTSITVTTSNRITYTYKVSRVATVAPSDVNVIAQVPGRPQVTPTKAMLTLVTCWPANGHSKRVVVTAELVGSNGGTSAR